MRLPRMAGPPESGTSRPAEDLAKVVTEEPKATEAHSHRVYRPRWPGWISKKRGAQRAPP